MILCAGCFGSANSYTKDTEGGFTEDGGGNHLLQSSEKRTSLIVLKYYLCGDLKQDTKYINSNTLYPASCLGSRVHN